MNRSGARSTFSTRSSESSSTVAPSVSSTLQSSNPTSVASSSSSAKGETEDDVNHLSTRTQSPTLIQSRFDRRSGDKGYRFSTICSTVDDPNHKDQYGSSSTPIYMSATFKGLPGSEFDYSRSGNPTRSMLQHHLSQLQNCQYSFAVSSGMACLDVITRVLKPGQRILAGDDLYGGTNRLLGFLKSHGDIITDHVDTTDSTKVEALLKQRHEEYSQDPKIGKISMVLLETPTNPLIKIIDLKKCCEAAKRWAPDALIVVDNTMMSPYLMRPLELGADIVYDSGTKYLSGHHDLMAGVVACDREDVGKQLAFTINSVGNALTPMDSFLLLRGIKTLAVRMDRQQASAQLVADYLDRLGFKVNYPGLDSHPGKEIHDSQAAGPGAVLSFTTGDKQLSERIVGAARLWGISVSFGCVNSLISMPCLMSHASIDPKVRAERGMPEDLIRLCVGIEDARDLLEDLESALLKAGAIRLKHNSPNNQSTSSLASSENDGISLLSPAFSEFSETHGGASIFDQYERVPLINDNPNGGTDTSKAQTRGGDPESRSTSNAGGGGRGLVRNVVAEKTTDNRLLSAPSSLLVSSPGKVILFGEHAVVHGVKAIAASVALKCYLSVNQRSDSKVSISLPDLDVEHVWTIDELPWGSIPQDSVGENFKASSELDQNLIKAIEKVVGETVHESERSHAASVAFLYLYLSIAQEKKNALAQCFTLRSTLPIGAGLGSSAALSSCISTALLYSFGRLPVPSNSEIPSQQSSILNSWSFLSEKVIHGNPSGVDNSVSIHGGALSFVRSHPSNGLKSNQMRNLNGFESFRFLLTNTKVGRDTKTLVANVGKQLNEEPERVKEILTDIQRISDQAEDLLDGSQSTATNLCRQETLEKLSSLIEENHQHLHDLKVSHETLELIKNTTKSHLKDRPLSTKLTGAGGGGCSVTLLPDDIDPEELASLKSRLENEGFECYETTVGGKGTGVWIPKDQEESFVGEEQILRDGTAEMIRSWEEKKTGWKFV